MEVMNIDKAIKVLERSVSTREEENESEENTL